MNTHGKPWCCTLREVTRSEIDVKELYQLLARREFGISHQVMPDYADHKAFVESNPYRAWFLIQYDSEFIGSVYLLDSNHMGINVIDGFSRCIGCAINQMCKRYKPLPPIASVRSEKFSINVSPNNANQVAALEGIGAALIQWTYQLP